MVDTQLLFLLLAEGMIARKNKWIPMLLDPYANNMQTNKHPYAILFASLKGTFNKIVVLIKVVCVLSLTKDLLKKRDLCVAGCI